MIVIKKREFVVGCWCLDRYVVTWTALNPCVPSERITYPESCSFLSVDGRLDFSSVEDALDFINCYNFYFKSFTLDRISYAEFDSTT